MPSEYHYPLLVMGEINVEMLIVVSITAPLVSVTKSIEFSSRLEAFNTYGILR